MGINQTESICSLEVGFHREGCKNFLDCVGCWSPKSGSEREGRVGRFVNTLVTTIYILSGNDVEVDY